MTAAIRRHQNLTDMIGMKINAACDTPSCCSEEVDIGYIDIRFKCMHIQTLDLQPQLIPGDRVAKAIATIESNRCPQALASLFQLLVRVMLDFAERYISYGPTLSRNLKNIEQNQLSVRYVRIRIETALQISQEGMSQSADIMGGAYEMKKLGLSLTVANDGWGWGIKIKDDLDIPVKE
jgi:hypothetical protein